MVSSKNGFSLLELSIVLVIIGLLAGGVIAGQSLVRGAELRSVVTDAQKYMSARNSFRLKYNAVPGDFRDSTRYWGRQVNVASCVTNSGAAVSTNGTCDGNGDGIIIAGSTGAGLSGEVFQFWRHLALAGMVEGNFSGLAGPSGTAHHQTGINTPESKIASVGWGGGFVDNSSGVDSAMFRRNYSNSFTVGIETTAYQIGPFLKADEAYSIDQKLDDGLPGSGVVNAWPIGPGCNTAASNTDYSSQYNLVVNFPNGCALIISNEKF